MVEKRRPHFQRMRHAHAVCFIQNIVGKKEFLIEPQIRLQMVAANEPIAEAAENAVESVRKFRAQQGCFLCFRESAIPVDMSALRSDEGALEKSLQLVFEADFFVRNRPDL